MATRTLRTTRHSAWPDCHGTVAGLIRTAPWRLTPLGPIETWPQALKTAVEILLQGRQPGYVCWGRALTTIYNDAAIAALGSRHPDALGRPYPEIFPDGWGDLRPVIEAAFAGEAQHIVGQRTARGGEHPASWNTYTWMPIRDDKGAVAGLYCVATETSLEIGQNQFRTILENAHDAVSMLDLTSGKYVFLSPAHTIQTGFTRDELMALTPEAVRDRYHPDDIERFSPIRPAGDMLFEGTAEFRWKVKSGEYRWFSGSRKVVRDANGRPVALIGVSRDITESKRAALEIEAGRATLDAALESMNDAVYITDAEGRFLRTNTRFATFHRFPHPDECPPDFQNFAEMFDVYFPDCSPAAPEQRPVPRALRGESAVGCEYHLVRRDTGEAWIGSYSFAPIREANGTITGAVVTARDITKQRQAEEALRRSEARHAIAVECADMGTWEWDLTTNAVIRSPKIYELLGIEPLEGADDANNFWRMVLPEDLPGVLAGIDDILKSGHDWRAEFRVRRADGSLRWIVGDGRLFRNPDGSPRAMFGVNYDITEQKEAEAALKQSEARYRLLHDTLRDGYVQVSMDGYLLDCNDVFCDMVGYSREELYQLTYLDLTPKRWHAAEKAIIEYEVLPRGYSDLYEKEYRRKDGTIMPVELRTVLARDENGQPASMWALVRDLREKRTNEARMQSLKDQLVHAGRINELSQVSAGIAHELNQPLAAMLNYSATAKRLIARNDPGSSEAAARAIAQAGEQAQRAGAIIRRMRDFVEKCEPHQDTDDINAIVREAAELGLIGAKAGGIEIVFDLAADLPAVIADRVQIEQVLVNLLHNAIDAMAEAPRRRLTLATRKTAGSIEVAISDTGCGLPDSVAATLFQPFVTTKLHGMGIGLAISRTIIEAHGGEISAHAQDGLTTFRFTLPTS